MPFQPGRIKTGGKRAGQHNRATIERHRMLEGAGLTPITKASPLAKDVLRDCMNQAMAQVRLYAIAPDRGPEEGKELEFEKAEKERDAQLKQWMNMAVGYAAKLAQYESPRLEAVYVQQHDAQGDQGPFGKSKSLDDVLKKLEARSGPEARALFERFLKEAAKLERSGDGHRKAW
jgi:hypothetical protein